MINISCIWLRKDWRTCEMSIWYKQRRYVTKLWAMNPCVGSGNVSVSVCNVGGGSVVGGQPSAAASSWEPLQSRVSLGRVTRPARPYHLVTIYTTYVSVFIIFRSEHSYNNYVWVCSAACVVSSIIMILRSWLRKCANSVNFLSDLDFHGIMTDVC